MNSIFKDFVKQISKMEYTYLVVSDNFDFSMLEDTNAGIGGSEINTDCGGFRHFEF